MSPSPLAIDLHAGDNIDMLRSLPDHSIDAVVTDPPYGLTDTSPRKVSTTLQRWLAGEDGFVPEGAGVLGHAWDRFVPPPAVWKECLRVMKPGAHLLAFASSRTLDLMMLSLRLSGFDIRDTLMWIYSSGIATSTDLHRTVSAAHGPEAAADLVGVGTGLRPSHEPLVLARASLEGTITDTVHHHGTGGLNIDAARIPLAADEAPYHYRRGPGGSSGNGMAFSNRATTPAKSHPGGRHPGNVIIGSDAVDELDRQDALHRVSRRSDRAGAARFFYCPKPRADERDEVVVDGKSVRHPTQKPAALMEYLIDLVCPAGGTVLDPFCGSGTTGEAAWRTERSAVLAENDPAYVALVHARAERTGMPLHVFETAGELGSSLDS